MADTGNALTLQAPLRVLVVDDEAPVRQLMASMLKKFGYEVVVAADGKEARDILTSQIFPIVITDWLMPGIDGLELCRWIRGGQCPDYVYIIVLTARQETEDTIAALNAGADEFLTKPLNPEELRVRMRTAERMLGLQSRDLALFAMAQLVEARDPDTGEHLHRMQEFTRLLLENLRDMGSFESQMTADFMQTVYTTCVLHDIGKVSVPDSILLKPARLSDSEFTIMKTHTTSGADTVDQALKSCPFVSYLAVARDIALSHHERFDGTGYPRGLAGDEIPLSGRIVSLADVYDALISRRVYKAAMPHEVARGMIVSERGKQFDPDVVDAFERGEGDFIALAEGS